MRRGEATFEARPDCSSQRTRLLVRRNHLKMTEDRHDSYQANS